MFILDKSLIGQPGFVGDDTSAVDPGFSMTKIGFYLGTAGGLKVIIKRRVGAVYLAIAESA